MPKHRKHLRLLCGIAEQVDPVRSSRHAAAVVYRNDIMGVGVNKMKSHPFAKRYGRNSDAIYLHAETAAVKNARREIEEHEFERSILYVVRVKHKGKKLVPALSKPCKGCCRCISEFGISEVIYTTDEGYEKL